MDKGYINPSIDAYAEMIGRKAIIDQKSSRGSEAPPMCPATAIRYRARTTVERTNSELKDGFLPDKIYKRDCHARYEIELAVLLTTIKMATRVLERERQARAG
jgi:hypothetical protein